MYQILLLIRIGNNHNNQIEWTTKTAFRWKRFYSYCIWAPKCLAFEQKFRRHGR